MCGIAGFIGRLDPTTLERMTGALAHRGPDGQGYWTEPELGVHLGHRRLAILDIVGGAQPMWNEDGTVGIVFNGEIYNHAELREELIHRGHLFRSSHSDTEVLVHGFEEWGTHLAERLNGMFAFAIVDLGRRQLFLARDRFGEKPLYYCAKPGFFGFASELTALALHPSVDRFIDRRSLQKYFAYGFLPASNAILEDVRKLTGGSTLTYDIATGAVELRRYWRFQIEPDEALDDRAEPRLVDTLRDRLLDAVRRRLISDVPLGIYLSGGLDSSTVLAFARRAQPNGDLRTFTVGFSEHSYDETAYAAQVAELFGTTHVTEILDLHRAQKLVPAVLGRLDEPLGDPSIIPTFLLARFTRKHVTVALAGDGGDELFAGYDPFAALRLAKHYRRLVPHPIHRLIRRLANLLPRSARNMSFDYKVRRALLGLSYPPSLWNPVWLSPMDPEMIRDVFEAPLDAEELYSEAIACWDASPHLDLVDRTLEYYTNFYLRDDILTKVDRAAMMNSLESRAVFLDNDLVDFVRRLPHRFKMRNGERKYLLKRALRGVVPENILGRHKKGFGIPLVSWLRDLDVPLPCPDGSGLLSARLRPIIESQRKGTADNRLGVWAWLAYRSGQTTADLP